MTSIAHRYADFSFLDPDGTQSDPVPLERVEDQKLQAFEEGYQAGWTDAEKNYVTEQKSVTDEILHTLRDLSFTYQEAQERLNQSLQPMFEHLMKSLLPRTTNAAVRAHVVEQLVEISTGQTKGQITLRVSEIDLPMIEDLLDGIELTLPVVLSDDPTLYPHQLFVSLDMLEREINLDAVCQEITTAMQAFNFHSRPEHSDD